MKGIQEHTWLLSRAWGGSESQMLPAPTLEAHIYSPGMGYNPATRCDGLLLTISAAARS